MDPKCSVSAEGVSSKGLFGTKSVRWADVGICRLEGGALLLFFQPKPEAHIPWVDELLVPPAEVVPTLLAPSFPRWMVASAQVEGLHDPRLSPKDFGPPSDTKWVARAAPTASPEVELWPASLGKLRGFAYATSRLGLFAQGAAFERTSGEMAIISWRLVRLFFTHSHFVAGWVQGTKEPGGLGEDHELDEGQARALASYPSGRAWDLPDEVYAALKVERSRPG